jgi:hypothetical protein
MKFVTAVLSALLVCALMSGASFAQEAGKTAPAAQAAPAAPAVVHHWSSCCHYHGSCCHFWDGYHPYRCCGYRYYPRYYHCHHSHCCGGYLIDIHLF